MAAACLLPQHHSRPFLPLLEKQFLRRYLSSQEPSSGLQDEVPRLRSRSSSSTPKTKRARDIAAIINRKSWSRELESSISSLFPSPLSRTTVLQALQLIKSPSKALSFFHWVGSKSGFTHDEQSYFAMLEILGRNRNLNVARNFLFSIAQSSNGDGVYGVRVQDKFFNSLIRSYGRAGLFQESVKLFEDMKSKGVSPSAVTFNCLFSILLKRGRTNKVKSLYDEMLSTYGVSPDAYTFNILIRGFCMNRMVDEGFHFFKEMSRFDVEPDVITYNTLVDGLCREGKVVTASNVVKGMCKKGKDLNPNVVTYTTLVRGFCAKGEIDEALKVVLEMVNRGVKPNIITYNTLVKGLCEAQKFDRIKEVLDGSNFVPDTCTFNTLMHAHCNAGNLGEALQVFEKMQELRVQPDSATYSIMIRSLTQGGEFERAEKYFDELLEKEILSSDKGCRPLAAAYNPMFEYLCRSGKTEKAEKLFRQLMKRGVQDPPSYRTLIMGHCKEGSFVAGFELLVLMLRRDYLPDFEIYLTLIEGLLQNGNPILAYKTLEKMLKSSHHPKTSVFHSVLAELLKKKRVDESASLVMLMLEKQIRQNVHLATDTVRLLLSRGLRDKAFEVIKMLYNNGFVVEVEAIIGFLCESRRLMEAHALSLFALEKQERVGTDLFDSIIRGLCENKRVSEAFSLFYELVERGQTRKLSCLDKLTSTLVAEGRNVEAEFVSKRMPPCAIA
ncbi:pentatricopeptide repeat-containing protein At1g02060, chloroplastic [Punica granatum]|uniref:Pentatricopeptide repeat-containing protein At1g02060, chloroplastic n=2 Tax=Punica granatum TaxID=22663 RepID=A0A6P8DM21_PUNGR|nr:pentatricopeptide repeat-containing protein At1g02060, chloroplastic [Punica granatum]XP_031397218.1 pentatricopeptide repeat-containing protein At1g02060, chloroplastic [Punica granatum]XP_031397219.1 pentatricopeptide repeat-containing protein At1g02060, chloroplastic [Punica granatum]XP_031397220.1 pentatricopeptide repeat-containing protein At1g02060, chloroplastic [Punica granatum]XP_031397221.1 pentatricopeptide repeat-containing protein At1g02060, chloroplastic [Punica granatum]PKI77